MMKLYAESFQGKSHIERGVVCQDYSKTEELKGGWCIGIVSDGVGSAPHSDIGSRLATEALCEYCQKNINASMSADQIEDLLNGGYEYAFQVVSKHVSSKGDNIADYDATLHSAIYNGTTLVYGHAGDGGILVRCNDGKIKPITQRQKGADGTSVRPLRAGNGSWEFGVYAEEVASVLIVTDGLLDGVFQPVLVNLPPSRMALVRGDFKKDNAYITVSEFFMNPYSIYLNKKVKDADGLISSFIEADFQKEHLDIFKNCMYAAYYKLLGKQQAEHICNGILDKYYAIQTLRAVTDDKSLVLMINDRAKVTPQDVSYYQEPDWEKRQREYQDLLYGSGSSNVTPVVPKNEPIKKNPRPVEPKGQPEPVVNAKSRFEGFLRHKRGILISTLLLLCVVVTGSVLAVLDFWGKTDDSEPVRTFVVEQNVRQENQEEQEKDSDENKENVEEEGVPQGTQIQSPTYAPNTTHGSSSNYDEDKDYTDDNNGANSNSEDKISKFFRYLTKNDFSKLNDESDKGKKYKEDIIKEIENGNLSGVLKDIIKGSSSDVKEQKDVEMSELDSAKDNRKIKKVVNLIKKINNIDNMDDIILEHYNNGLTSEERRVFLYNINAILGKETDDKDKDDSNVGDVPGETRG